MVHGALNEVAEEGWIVNTLAGMIGIANRFSHI